jgi:hypothetical protein
MFRKEALFWRQLRHPRILPFLGIDANSFASIETLCMVSPWISRGTILEYVRSQDYRADTDRLRLVKAPYRPVEHLADLSE